MPIKPEILWHSFGAKDCLKNALQIRAVPFQSESDSFLQLRYIEQYAADLNCECFAIETHYIDRDYIEDHSAFYSKSLNPYPNFCKRVHFFAGDVGVVAQRLTDAVRQGTTTGIEAYRAACRKFSADHYLGFAVIKPLQGTPVGRTVMKCYPSESSDGTYRRRFCCTKEYVAHFHGCELTVSGLAFQQQDIGVSACATTALWSALQKTADAEPIAAMTPVQITQYATRYSLPSGRPMPSEGLNIGQMCSAVQATGASPNLFRVEGNHRQARIILRTAILSGFAPVLALHNPMLGGHAVTAVGLKETVSSTEPDVHFHEHVVTGIYLHDDRLGPNLKCTFRESPNPDDSLGLDVQLRDSPTIEQWELRYILVPMHPKIRLSFADLESISSLVLQTLLAIHKVHVKGKIEVKEAPIGFDCRVLRAHHFLERLIVEDNGIDPEHLERIGKAVAPARYLGVIRVSGPFFSQFDLVVDTTGTLTNPNYLGVIPTEEAEPGMKAIGRLIALITKCPFVE
ncbi:hypothetical protein [Blastopirellula marina]|uniref:Uncharacterized protein n=1 Tax=Blastopirellula marina TaxID=124 RepID=A0A2S8F9W6_9BACT|nr:hypothetical protein [Blastopirellula marina]PQO28910.1 hypothetical protein C5Y98_24430 [Blastopirellula marina]PTL42183.1 hypothetical protein C5Y97_24445 [Blastopirellula marina]